MIRDVLFGDAGAWQDFVLQNAISHSEIGRAIAKPTFDLPITNTADMRAWLADHAAIHSAELEVLGVTTPIDLSQVDLNNRSEFEGWMFEHYTIHAQTSALLGIDV